MSIADKLVKIAQNVEKVFEAGKNGFGFRKSFSGETLEIANIVPIRHGVFATMTSKNLFEKTNQNIKIDPSKTYFLSSGEKTPSRIQFQLFDIEGNRITKNVSCYGVYFSEALDKWMTSSDTAKLKHTIKFSGTDRDKIAYIRFLSSFPNMQLEQGASASAYVPHISDFSNVKLIVNGSDIYSADENGTAQEMKSAPTMNIISNTPGVIITAECFIDAAAYIKNLETKILKLGGTI